MRTIDPLPPQDNNDDRQVKIPSRDSSHGYGAPDREVAANVVRNQIDRLYDDGTTNPSQEHPAVQQDSQNNKTTPSPDPYHKVHQQDALKNTQHSDAWKEYHSAWQNYYQQYYKRYYMQQLQQNNQKSSGSEQSNNKVGSQISPKEATSQLHDEVIEKVKRQASALRKSTHFMPIVTAIVVGLFFLLIQYNRVFVAQVKAYVSPGSSTSQSIILDPVTNTKVSAEPRIIIPKINVDAPVVYGVNSLKENDIQAALRNGVVHYPYPGANSLPGQVGNTVLLGHTSNDVFDPGGYKFVFVLMERLREGDTIYLHYEGTRYTYLVKSREVVNPNQINKLVIPTDKPLVTLVGCVPIGTADQRLLVTAEQISPNPDTATVVEKKPGTKRTQPSTLPAQGSNFLERLFR